MHKLLSAFFLVLPFSFAAAQESRPAATVPDGTGQRAVIGRAVEPADQCPRQRPLRAVCTMIGSKMKNDEHGADPRLPYLYQARFREAACVAPEDTVDVERRKLQAVWNRYEALMVCNSSRFDVTDGHLLKWAIANDFDAFVTDVIGWQVNLNIIDSSGSALLDYVAFHRQRNHGNSFEQKYDLYHSRLRRAGARYAAELLH